MRSGASWIWVTGLVVALAGCDGGDGSEDAGPLTCASPEMLCGGECVDVSADPDNCGACGMTCGMGEVCASGACAIECPSGQTVCGGGCFDLQTSRAHCGACDDACADGEVCSGGTCGATCGGDTPTLCGAACVDTDRDRDHCGMCDMGCMDGEVCVAGACATSCPASQIECGGACVDPMTDRAYCGASGDCDGMNAGDACADGEVCAGGACATSCPASQIVCGGACVDPMTDRAYCGASGDCAGTNAGDACADGEVCAMGSCQLSCAASQIVCGGACVDPMSDRAYCGASGDCLGMNAGVACSSGEVCSMGGCAPSCGMGLMDCSGSCVDTFTNPMYCGSCTNTCTAGANATPFCDGGTCAEACNAGFADCDVDPANGCEAQLASDVSNCGRCGNACPMGEVCRGGACATVAFTTSPAPVPIPSSTGCQLLLDTNADQIDALDDGTVVVLLRCAGQLRMALSTDGAVSFAAPVTVTGVGLPEAAAVFARSADDIFVLYGVTPNVSVVRTTSRGATWTAPVMVGTAFTNSGPGPSVMITGRSGSLYATWSSMDSTVRVRQSTTDGASWIALPDATISGLNYCPDLGFDVSTGDLLLLNEVNRDVYRLPPMAASWSLVGSLLPEPSPFSDFAVGGPYAYATGAVLTVTRGSIASGTGLSPVTSMVVNPDMMRSMDADAAGNLGLALNAGVTGIRIYRWAAGAASIDAGTDVAPGGQTPALAMTPTANASVTAIFSSTSVPVVVHVQTY